MSLLKFRKEKKCLRKKSEYDNSQWRKPRWKMVIRAGGSSRLVKGRSQDVSVGEADGQAVLLGNWRWSR